MADSWDALRLERARERQRQTEERRERSADELTIAELRRQLARALERADELDLALRQVERLSK